MRGLLKHPVRVISRLVWLGCELLFAAFNYVFCIGCRKDSHSLRARAGWLQASSRRMLRIFDAEIVVAGESPKKGLLVCNHLSYLDILVLSAHTPCIFVAKSDIRNWPIFGWFTRIAGTLYADRGRRTQVGSLTAQMQRALEAGALVVLFPEGTSSGGCGVLPFKSALLELATNPAYALAASHLHYELQDGDVAEEVCYWKDMTFGPHLVNLLSKRRIQAYLAFSEITQRSKERKELAHLLHAKVTTLQNTFKQCTPVLQSSRDFLPVDGIRC
jgi:lyso-ornithine lipid O-acyltransferase